MGQPEGEGQWEKFLFFPAQTQKIIDTSGENG